VVHDSLVVGVGFVVGAVVAALAKGMVAAAILVAVAGYIGGEGLARRVGKGIIVVGFVVGRVCCVLQVGY